MAAFRGAVEQGAHGVELDVQLSADGVPVVFHDTDLRRLGRAGCRVADLEASELSRIDVGELGVGKFGVDDEGGHWMPTLENVFTEFGDRLVFCIEIKAAERFQGSERELRGLEALLALVDRLGLWSRVVFLCFDRAALRALRTLDVRARCYLNVESLVDPSSGESLLSSLDDALEGISVDIDAATPQFARGLRERGLGLLLWTVNSEEQFRRAFELDPDALLTDTPREARQRFPDRFLERGSSERHGTQLFSTRG